ncbi:hypothetical protein [Mahella australiensis]|uniref:Lipoprotein n=1 Tax=Mahella australiensis (strain DSM 15567 / CIP 107919 / 50-1 BON) TaxID=697281 RepID=F3ZZ42_MAHA5|nr:hypothetical protein [Mahella australiensis]AEE96801.1 hypothetical protein Mahau_1615 [Mahella australiensis 50-1 BON]
MVRKQNVWILIMLVSFFSIIIVACDNNEVADPSSSKAIGTPINNSQTLQSSSPAETIASLPVALRAFYSYVHNVAEDAQANNHLFSDIPGLKKIHIEQVLKDDTSYSLGNETVYPEDSSFESGSPEKSHLNQMLSGVFSIFNDRGNCTISYPIMSDNGVLNSVITFDTLIPYNSNMETSNDYEFDVLFFNGESIHYYDEAINETIEWPRLTPSAKPLIFKSADKINPQSKEMLYQDLVVVQDNKMTSIANADRLLRSLLDRMTHSTTYQTDIALIEDINIVHETDGGALFEAVIALGEHNGESSRYLWDTHTLYASYVKQDGYCVLNIIGNNAVIYLPNKAPDTEKIGEMFADTIIRPYMFSTQPIQDRVYQYKVDSVKKSTTDDNNNIRYNIKFSVLTAKKGNTTWLISDGVMNEDGWVINKDCELDLIRYGEYYEAVVNLQKG